MGKMSPRRCVEEVLHHGSPEYIPFAIWNNKLPEGSLKEEILSAGACVIVKSHVYKESLNHVKKEESFVKTNDDEHTRKHIVYYTPFGELEETMLVGSSSDWREKYIFNDSNDYNAIKFLLNDIQYIPCFDLFLHDDSIYGDQGLARPDSEKSPMFQIMYDIMGLMNFAVEWLEHQNKVLELYEILMNKRKEKLKIIADSPAQYAVIDGNLVMNVIGKERFNAFYIPAITEACNFLHAYNKVTGVHLDGNNRDFIKPFADLPVDMIESLTPPPDCDLSIEEALKVWPEKCFMVNFPSSLHLGGQEVVKSAALEMLSQAKGSNRVIIGIFEDVPRNDTIPMLARLVTNYAG